jgi:multidrug resistance protein
MATHDHDVQAKGLKKPVTDISISSIEAADGINNRLTLSSVSNAPSLSHDPASAEKTSEEPKNTTDIEAQAAAPPPETPIYSIFSKRMKVMIVIMTSLGSLFSPLSSTIYLPALNTIASDLHKSTAAINLTVTSYMIFQGLAPMFFGDLGDMIGRRPVYITAFAIYFFANLGLALQNNYTALIILRALQSTGSSATIALGNGVMSDIATSAERGGYMAWVTAGALLGPALAPTIGGLLAQYLGWHSLFWFLVICGGIYLIVYLFFVPETARNIVGDGSLPDMRWSRRLIIYVHRRKSKVNNGLYPQGEKEPAVKELAKTHKLRFPNPLKALRIVVEKDVAFLLFFTSIMVTTFQCLFVIIPSRFKDIYGFSDLTIGLCYLYVDASPLPSVRWFWVFVS